MINLFNMTFKNHPKDQDITPELAPSNKNPRSIYNMFTSKSSFSNSYESSTSKKGFDENGLHKNGTYFDDEGFSIDGFSKEGIDRHGFNRGGYNKMGFNREGFDIEGFNIHGFDKHGFDRSGFDKNGFDRRGIDKSGYNKEGFDNQGFDRNGLDLHGYTKEGFDIHGFDRNGFNQKGYNKFGYDKHGYDINGYDKRGFDKDGFDKQGYNVKGEFKEFIDSQLKSMYSLYILNSNNLYKENVKNTLLYLKLAKESIKNNNTEESVEYFTKLSYVFCDEFLKEKGIVDNKHLPLHEKLEILSGLILPNKYLEVIYLFTRSDVHNVSEFDLKKVLQTFSNMTGEWIGKLNRT